MTAPEIRAFVDRLGHRKVDFDEFRALTASDWEAIKGLLLDRRDTNLKRHIDAMYRFRKRMEMRAAALPRTYSETEIIAELERPG